MLKGKQTWGLEIPQARTSKSPTKTHPKDFKMSPSFEFHSESVEEKTVGQDSSQSQKPQDPTKVVQNP